MSEDPKSTTTTATEGEAHFVQVVPGSREDFVFLELFHGWDVETAKGIINFDVMGFDGPVLGPFLNVACVENAYLRLAHINGNPKEDNILHLHTAGQNCIRYGDKAYGAFKVLAAHNVVKGGLAKRIEDWDDEKAGPLWT